MNPFLDYSKKALTRVPARLIGPTKTRREAIVKYHEIVGELQACRDVTVVQAVLGANAAHITQFHAELEFLWAGDGDDFLGLEREIENAFETAEAASFFKFRANPEGEAGRSPGHFDAETELRT